MGESASPERNSRDDAFFAFVVPLAVVFIGGLTTAVGLTNWIGGIVGVVLALIVALSYRWWGSPASVELAATRRDGAVPPPSEGWFAGRLAAPYGSAERHVRTARGNRAM